jgi:hypothetical protein
MNRDEIVKELEDLWMDIQTKLKIKGLVTKFKNVSGKTSRKDVPVALWTKRTSRTNRVLLRWTIVRKQECLQKIDNLEKFTGGVCVEFVNGQQDDIEKSTKLKELKKELINNRLGGNDLVTSIISVRNELGDSGSVDAWIYIEDLMKKNKWDLQTLANEYFSERVCRKSTKKNYNHKLNVNWKGKYFIDVKGAKQSSVKNYRVKEKGPQLFNPAFEYASEEVCQDIYCVLSYFAFFAIDNEFQLIHNNTLDNLKNHLYSTIYNGKSLLEYCTEHPSLKLTRGKLIDPITMDIINIKDFNEVELCHNISYANYKFKVDNGRLLSAASPDNLFWGFRESNKIQLEYDLHEYYKILEERVKHWRSIYP